MDYQNITRNGNVILTKDKIYTRKQLFANFEIFISYSNFFITKVINLTEPPFEIHVSNNEKEYVFYFFLKNITGAGWKNKPKIKRIQIKNTTNIKEKLIITNDKQLFLLLGYYNFDDNPIMVAWDPYRYDKHNTVRSCYVTTDLLLLGYQEGFAQTSSSGNIIWIFDKFHFNDFLLNYINYELEHSHVTGIA